MKRQHVLIGIVVVLAGVAAYVWSTQEGTESDPILQQTKFQYTCIHCQHNFELTMQDEIDMTRNQGGVICPSCNQSQEPSSARKDAGIFEPPPIPPDQEPPPQVQGGLRKKG